MQFPALNLNGTNGETLRAENFAAYEAVEQALIILNRVTVHGRDYQTITDIHGAYLTAQREHSVRIRMLEAVRNELAAITANIDEQLEERKRA